MPALPLWAETRRPRLAGHRLAPALLAVAAPSGDERHDRRHPCTASRRKLLPLDLQGEEPSAIMSLRFGAAIGLPTLRHPWACRPFLQALRLCLFARPNACAGEPPAGCVGRARSVRATAIRCWHATSNHFGLAAGYGLRVDIRGANAIACLSTFIQAGEGRHGCRWQMRAGILMASTVEEGETECSQRHQTLVQTRSRRSASEPTATPNRLASMCAIRAGFPHRAGRPDPSGFSASCRVGLSSGLRGFVCLAKQIGARGVGGR